MNATMQWIERGGRPDWLEERDLLDIGTLGDAMFQEVVNRVIQVCHKRVIAAVSVLEFRRGSGDAHHLNRLSPTEDDAEWVDDTDQPDCGDTTDCKENTYAKVTFPYKCMLACAAVTRKAVARGRDYADLLALEVAGIAERLTYTLEKAIFRGDETADPKQFDGLMRLLEVYNGNPAAPANGRTQVFVADGADITTGVGGQLTLSLLDKALDEVKEGPKVIFVSKTGSRIINALLQAQQNFNDRTVIAGGFRVATYDDYPIIKTDGVPNDSLIGDDAGGFPIYDAITGEATNPTTSVVIVNTDEVWIDELTPMTIEPLARCTTQRQKFEGYWDGTLVLGCPESGSLIMGIIPDC